MNFCKSCDPSNKPLWKPDDEPAKKAEIDPLICKTDCVICGAGEKATAEFLVSMEQRRKVVGTVFREDDFLSDIPPKD